MRHWLQTHWYRYSWLAILLSPLAWIFRALVRVRYHYYQSINRKRPSLSVPVIVVGNITVGGTGKTPLVIYLARWLATQGHRPGIITRGYGGKSACWPIEVLADSDPEASGDEPVLIASSTGCPVIAGPDRLEDAELLLRNYDCTVIISDDGLQHYALKRDIEIAVIDGMRRLGNGRCLPAGPLREPVSRLQRVDFILVNGGTRQPSEYAMDVVHTQVRNLANDNIVKSLADFRAVKVHAVAGIGNSERYFNMLEQMDIHVVRHAFADHYSFKPEDIRFADTAPVLMTEKDAVKCRQFTTNCHWVVCMEARPEEAFQKALLTRIESLKDG